MSAEIVVQGVSEIRVMPDHASIRVDVEGEGSSQEAAYEAITALAQSVDTVLEGQASVIGRVVTAALMVQPKSRWRKGEAVRTGWRASRSTLVEITAAEEVGSLLAQLARAGGAVRGPWWEIAPANPAHDTVRTAAATDARRRAAAYAAGLGLVVGDVAWVAEPGLRIGARGSDWGDEPYATAATGELRSLHEEEQAITVAPGEITLTAAVEIGFEFRVDPAPAEPG